MLVSVRAYALTESEFMAEVISDSGYFAKDKINLDIKQIELDSSRKSYTNWQKDVSITHSNSYYKY